MTRYYYDPDLEINVGMEDMDDDEFITYMIDVLESWEDNIVDFIVEGDDLESDSP